MKYTTRPKNWWLLVFSLFAFLQVQSQSVGETWKTAIAEEQFGQYHLALQKFERVLFFKPDTLGALLYLHIGNCKMQIGEYYKARESFDNALLADVRREHQNEILIQKLKAEILAHNMRFALITISEIDTVNDKTAKDQVVFYEGAIHFYKEEYPAAETSWLKLVSQDSSKRQRVKHLFMQNKKVNRLKPGIAIALSVILPGAGQVYAGDVRNGINSLLLVGGFFVLGYNTAVAYNILNAIIAVGPWYLRYYEGGFTKAGQMVMAKRAKRHQEIYRQLLEVLKK